MADETATPSVSGATTSSSSNTSSSSREYDVFLNFRGPDSRLTVADVIYKALDHAGVRVFYDDESIRPGEVIEGELEEAIIRSKIYIPIFSKGYASSKWCLHELRMIIDEWKYSEMLAEMKQSFEKKTILPIFYDVDVSTDLKLKSELYATALQKHKDMLGEDVVERWEVALRKAATIKGWDLRNYGLTDLTKRIVEEVCRMLWTRIDSKTVSNDYVGIDYPMADIIDLLDLKANDVRFVFIHGLGGVGKTTLARLVFNKISSDFGQMIAFLSDIREKTCRDAGILDLQKDLISQLLQVNSSFLQDVDHGVKMIKDRLKDKKVLIILDDLNKSDQLLKLAGEISWFGMRSRIIVTTRDVGLMPKQEGFYPYKIQEMKYDDALTLFCKRVFKCVTPPKEYGEISREVVDITGRLPLAIGVIASLFENSSADVWQFMLEKLKKVVHEDIREKLMISYEQLDYGQKEIFLDIACLFNNTEIEDATYYWEARGLCPRYEIMVLNKKSLLEIVDGNKLWMHDLLRDLGRNIVDEENGVHGRRSRLWSPDIAPNFVCQEKGTDKVMALKLGELNADCTFNLNQIAGLTNLNFLGLKGGNLCNEDFKEAFLELRWLSWDDCPPEFQATNLRFVNLVVLILSENLITDDWGGWDVIKVMNNLKVLKCIYCRYLTKSPNCSTLLKLERLVFKNCATLRQIDPSIGKLKRLNYLEITNPFIYEERLPDEYISYQLEEGGPEILPNSFGNIRSLSVLKLKFVNLSKLPDSIGELINLEYLCLWCPLLKELPETVQFLVSLVELDISFTGITRLPFSLVYLKKLEVLRCENCRLEEDAERIVKVISSLARAKRLTQISLDLPGSRLSLRSLEGRRTWIPFSSIGTERIESLKNK